MNYKTLITLVFVIFLALNCSTSSRTNSSSSTQGSGSSTPTPTPTPTQTPIPASEVGTPVADGPYTQTTSAVGGKVDVLFVLDSSSSIDAARAKISASFSTFVGEFLNIGTVNVAFILSWGDPNPNGGYEGSGHLYHVGTNPYVLTAHIGNSGEMTNLQTALAATLALTPPDQPSATSPPDDGELGMYSVKQLVTVSALTNEAKSRGFLNTGAALVVIFVADENDICAIYPSPSDLPPWVPSNERDLHATYCPSGIAGSDLYAWTKAIKGINDPVQFDGLVYTSPVSYAYEQEMGYGYLDVIAASNGVAMDFGAADYGPGMQNFGNAINAAVAKLQRKFPLTRPSVNPLSIKVYVDGVAVTFTYLPGENAVVLDYAGHNGSVIDIDYRVY
jgi:hypothetical protein